MTWIALLVAAAYTILAVSSQSQHVFDAAKNYNDTGTFTDELTDATIAYSPTLQQFSNAFSLNGYPAPTELQYRHCMYRSRRTGQISSKRELAMFVAQVMHESGGLVYKSEWGCPGDSHCLNYQYPSWSPSTCGAALNAPCRTQPYSANTLYYGRGYMQLSWTVNYDAASWYIYGDDRLYTRPNIVSSVESAAWDTAFWYWHVVVQRAPGVADGWFGATTRAINGALECDGGPSGDLARARFQKYQIVFRAFGLAGTPDPRGCY